MTSPSAEPVRSTKPSFCHVERNLREVLIPRTAPISSHMILNYLAEKVLELPKSY
jgi:hypothetical protein